VTRTLKNEAIEMLEQMQFKVDVEEKNCGTSRQWQIKWNDCGVHWKSMF